MSDTTDVGQLFYIMFDVVIFAFAITVILTTHTLLIKNTYKVAALERVNTTISEVDDIHKTFAFVNEVRQKQDKAKGYNKYDEKDSRYRHAADQYDGVVKGSAVFSEIEDLPDDYECTIDNNAAGVSKGERTSNMRTKAGRKKVKDRIDPDSLYVRTYKVDDKGAVIGVNYVKTN